MSTPAATSVITFKSLRWSLALLLLACLATAAAVVVVFQLAQNTAGQHKQALAKQAETRARLARANDDEREIRSKIDRYQELIVLGRTQPERRLEWVEALRSIKQSRRLPGLDYEIAPQRPLDEKNRVTGGYEFLASPMKVEIEALHEGDLIGLLADLSAAAEALITVRTCKLERLPQNQGRLGANLKVACEMDWITLRERT
jgi:hypothetical protein